MRICGYGADNATSAEYRCYVWLRALERRGHTVWRAKDSKVESMDRVLKDAEVVILGRHNNTEMLAGLMAARQIYGTRLIIDTDDHTDATPHRHPSAGAWRPGGMLRKIARYQLKQADVATCTSPVIAESMRQHGLDLAVFPNCTDGVGWEGLASRQKEERHRSDVRIYWGGGAEHAHDLLPLAPVYASIAKKRSNVKFVFSNFMPDWALTLPLSQAFYIPFVPLAHYRQLLHWLCIDIVVSPLEHHEFNRAKSAVKYIEYGMQRLPGVYERFDPYVGINGGGILADEPEEWEAALLRLIDNPLLRREMGEAAHSDVLANHHVDGHIERYEAILASAMSTQEAVACQS